MKNYLAVFLGTGTSESAKQWAKLDKAAQTEREQAGKQAWMNWAIANASAIVDHGAPLGKTKRIGPAGITDVRNELTAYVVVRAESYEAAAKMFLNHPHFTIFPGDAVEVMECLPMPTVE